MSTVAKPRQRGGRRASQSHNGPAPGPLIIPQSQALRDNTTPKTDRPTRPQHSRHSSRADKGSGHIIDLTSPTLSTPTIRSVRGRSASIAKSSVAASPNVLRSAVQEAFPTVMPTKGPLVVTNARKKARYAFPFPTTLQQQQSMQMPYMISFTSAPVEVKVILQTNVKPKRTVRHTAPAANAPGQSKDNKSKSYMLDPPSIAHVYPFKDAAGKDLKEPKFPDFFPWRGNHPEDNVSEHAARNGFSDKMQNGEQGTAKNLLSPLIRQKMGLESVSALFVTVLEKRQQIGRITDPSSFKLPPRVTFTGPRKEAWLKDLASPNIPLRKLSRTIPHGLRARELLDECTSKNIPLLRAIWYVRCVGANELRSLKRKGAGSLAMGNETKWLREWTQAVVQYLEKGMSDCGKDITVEQPDWRTRITYILGLTTQLYSENLLDRSVFLEWYLNLLETCSLDRLPLAMLILQAEWDHIVSSRKFCRRLADALLGKAKQILDINEEDIYRPLFQRLSIHITKLLSSHRQAYVNPKSWGVNKMVLPLCVDLKNPIIKSCLENVSARNQNLDVKRLAKAGALAKPARKAVIDFLDVLTAPYNIEDVTTSFIMLAKDHHQIVKALCEWAITSLRVGLHRLYFAVRLLRRLSRMGVPIQNPVQDFLLSIGGTRRCKKHVYLLISELVRSKHFTAGKYMSWLISRGALMRYDSVDEDQPCYVRLLVEIPVNHNHTPNAQRNLRSNLLLQKGFVISDEVASLARAKNILSERIPAVFAPGAALKEVEAAFTAGELSVFRGLTRNVKSELGFWICDAVKRRQNLATASVQNKTGGGDTSRNGVFLSDFLLIRKVLEELEDFGVLAEVIRSISSLEVPEVLSAAADTLASNVEIYYAIGVLQEALKSLFDQYKSLQVKRTMEHRHVEQYLTAAIFHLAQFSGCDADIRQSLENDFILGKSHAPIQVATSESAFEFSDTQLDTSVEGLLTGTIALQEENMQKAFQSLIENVDASYRGTDMSAYKHFPKLLARLRHLDAALFDPLMENWLAQTIKSSSRPTLVVALSNLLVSDCVELKTVIKLASDIVSQTGEDSGSIEAADVTELAFQTLALLLDEEDGKLNLSEKEMYTLRLERKRFRASNGKLFVLLFRKAISLCVAAADATLERRLEDTMNNDIVLDLLRNLAFSDFDMLVSELVEPLAPQSNPLISKYLNLLIDHLLDEHDSSDISEVDADVQVTRLLQHVNDFSVRLCQLKMRLIFEAEIAHASDQAESNALRNAVTKAFVGAIAETNNDNGAIWADLVTVLDDSCISQIRLYTEEMILSSTTFPNASSSFTSLDTENPDAETKKASDSLARALLSAINVTSARGIVEPTSTWLPPILADKMSAVLQAISGISGEITIQPDGEITPSGGDVKVTFAKLRCWIILFLRIIALHVSEFSSAKTGSVEQGRMVIGLCALLQNSCVQNDGLVFDLTLDIACLIMDDIPDDSKNSIRRFLRKKYDIPQITYLLGGIELASNGVAMSSSGMSAGNAEWLKGFQKGRVVEFGLKPWEQVSDPTPVAGDNDTSLSMTLFHARRAGCRIAKT